MVGDDKEIMEIVRTFPVSAISEVLERIEILGREAALADLDDIKKRVATAQENYEKGKNSSLEEVAPATTGLGKMTWNRTPPSEATLNMDLLEM